MKVTTMQPIMVYLISCGNALHPILLVSQNVICLIPNYVILTITDNLISILWSDHFLIVITSYWLIQGTLVLIGGPTARNITVFAVLYVVGNVIALCATGFLLGKLLLCDMQTKWQELISRIWINKNCFYESISFLLNLFFYASIYSQSIFVDFSFI